MSLEQSEYCANLARCNEVSRQPRLMLTSLRSAPVHHPRSARTSTNSPSYINADAMIPPADAASYCIVHQAMLRQSNEIVRYYYPDIFPFVGDSLVVDTYFSGIYYENVWICSYTPYSSHELSQQLISPWSSSGHSRTHLPLWLDQTA